MRWLLWLFPKAWRERYGDEVLELLALSDRKPRNCIDLVVSALSLQIDRASEWREGGVHMRTLRLLSIALIAIGVATTGWAVAELADGVRELPSHWWSTLAAAPLATGLALATASWRPRRSPPVR